MRLRNFRDEVFVTALRWCKWHEFGANRWYSASQGVVIVGRAGGAAAQGPNKKRAASACLGKDSQSFRSENLAKTALAAL
jgi:hypothetical protein